MAHKPRSRSAFASGFLQKVLLPQRWSHYSLVTKHRTRNVACRDLIVIEARLSLQS